MNAYRSRRPLLLLTLAALLISAGPAWNESSPQTSAPARGTLEFSNGQWFDGAGFRRQTFFAVDGLLTQQRPPKVDEVVDLENGYVVPPFADAHTHHFDNPANVAAHVAMYLRDGVFYAKVLTDVRSRALEVAAQVNRPTSVDVSYSHGGLSTTHGHPMATYEGLALLGRPSSFNAEETQRVRQSRQRDNDAYYTIDTAADLENKWPRILEAKPDFIKVYLLYSEEYAARKDRPDTVGDRALNPALVPMIVARARAAGLRVSAHVTTVADYRVALRAGVDEMAHVPGSFIPSTADPLTFQLTEADAAETARRGVWVVPAPAYYEAFDPQSPAFNAGAKSRTEAVRISNLTLLRRHKAKLAFGSDSFGRTPLRDVLYVRTLGVFTNLELLKIWCEDTPRTIFPSRRLGRLAEGYEASLLVLGGNPLTDFAQISNITRRVKQGHLLDRPR